jgi:hypothetical protein
LLEVVLEVEDIDQEEVVQEDIETLMLLKLLAEIHLLKHL